MTGMTDAELQGYLKNIHLLPLPEQREILGLLDKLDDANKREKAQGKFIDFVTEIWPGFIAGNHHTITANAFDDIISGKNKRLIVNMPPRHRLATNTPIMTTRGWKTMATISVGDKVFAPDGSPVLVTGKSATYREPLYEVETTDGQVIECDGTHLWTVSYSTRGHPYFSTSFAEHSTEDIFKRGVPKRGGPYLPNFQAVVTPEAELPIDPYMLGVWLGDGTKYGAAIGCSYRDEPETRRLIEAAGYPTSDRDGYQMFGVLKLHAQLREEGLLENKHIPEKYLTASIDQRIALMQGLVDTDGSVGTTGRCTFHQTDRRMAEDFCSLVNSLGVKARITQRQTHYDGVPSKPSYRVNFRHPKAARMQRKASRLGAPSKLPGRAITVRKAGREGDVQCLEVANADGLFLAGRGMVCTHNTKSEFASKYFPAFAMGHRPDMKIIQASNTAELAVNFGRQVRDVVGSPEYSGIFPGVGLDPDSKAAGRWNTNKKGTYFAIGVGGTVSGRGADLLIIDDPHSEQEAARAEYDPTVFDSVYEWYTSGPRQRLQPGGAIVIVMTRWGLKDLTGQVTKTSELRVGSDVWKVINLPAMLDGDRPIWPEFWSKAELMALKAELPVSKWNAQYQQDPTAEEGAIIKREWWQKWEHKKPPKCDFTIMSWDTAFEKTQRADFSACTLWGIFYTENKEEGPNGVKQTVQTTNIILLDAFRDRWSFPELKAKFLKAYKKHQPDSVVIERKASGISLIQEMRAMGIPVGEFTPTKGNDKIARLNSISDIFASGLVWYPDTRWAEEVIEEVAAFPAGEHDDYVDTTSQALIRFRQGGFIRIPTDDADEESEAEKHAVADYY
jgi:predicted phage terminase large subunit-like protein